MSIAPDSISQERDIAVEAAWETEAVCIRMIEMCGLDRLDFRGMTARLLALSHASMAALCDDAETVESIRRRLGCKDFGNTTGLTENGMERNQVVAA